MLDGKWIDENRVNYFWINPLQNTRIYIYIKVNHERVTKYVITINKIMMD